MEKNYSLNIYLFIIILLITVYTVNSQIVPFASCVDIYQKQTFVKNYPCSWNESTLCSVITDPRYPIEFRCLNVPNNTLLSYDIIHLNGAQTIDHSVSVWWNDNVDGFVSTTQELFSNFLFWAQTSSDQRINIPLADNCVNYPQCLNITCDEYAITNFTLMYPSNSSSLKTVSVFINNENRNNTYDEMDILSIYNNSLTISSQVQFN